MIILSAVPEAYGSTDHKPPEQTANIWNYFV